MRSCWQGLAENFEGFFLLGNNSVPMSCFSASCLSPTLLHPFLAPKNGSLKIKIFFFTVWTLIRLWNTSLRRQEASYSVHAHPTPPPIRSVKKGRASLGGVSPTLQTGPTFFCWGHMYLSWPQLCCVVKDNLKLLICLPPASKCFNYKWFWLTKHLIDVIWNANFLEGRGNLLTENWAQSFVQVRQVLCDWAPPPRPSKCPYVPSGKQVMFL